MKNIFRIIGMKEVLGIAVLIAAVYVLGYFIFQPGYVHYKAAPISGKVVDKETGEPIEGVHVAVYWQYYSNGFVIYSENDYPTKVGGVSETITDEKGEFHIPCWEVYFTDQNKIGGESPIIGLYKKGYVFNRVSNFTSSWGNENSLAFENRNFPRIKHTEDGEVHLSIWNNFPAELEKTNNDINKIVLSLYEYKRFLRRIRFSEDKICHQKFIKKFISAYITEAKEVKELLKKLPKEKESEIRYSTTFIKYLNTDLGCVEED